MRRISVDKLFIRTLFFIAFPIIIQNLISTFVNIVDTIMVGRLGASEIAAVGLGNQIFFLLNMILFGVASGSGIFTAQFWGKKDTVGIHKTVGFSLTIAAFISAAFTVAALVAPHFIISLYSKDPVVIELGGRYLRSVALSYPMMAISCVFMFSLRSTEQVNLPMIATIISLAANVVFNYMLIFGIPGIIPPMGVVGAGIATVISRTIECIFLISVSYRKKLTVAATFRQFFSFDLFFVRRFIIIAMPVVLNEAVWALGITLQNAIFARAGTSAFAAFSITGTISQLTWVFFMGCGNAEAIMIGKKIGEQNYDTARLYARRIQTGMPFFAVFIALLLIPLSKLLPFFFAVDAVIIEQATLMMMVLMCCYPFNAFNMGMIVGVSRSGGDTVFSAIMDVAFMYAVALPLAAMAALVWHLPAWVVYLCLLSENPLKCILGIWRLRSGKWLHNVT